MILCVTLNAALDVTYSVDEVRWHAGNRVAAVAQRAGGKGVNVARVLHTLGEDVLVTGLVGGDTGAQIRADVQAAGLAEAFQDVTGESRRTVAVVDAAAGDATGFWEPGPPVAPDDWARFLDRYDGLLTGARAVVLTGSLPPGLSPEVYADLVHRARKAGVPVVLDADAEALAVGVSAEPDIVKPNVDELRRATGFTDRLPGAEALRAQGARAVVVSAGPDGLIASTPDGRWAARPQDRVSGNPTGAGDASVAALVRGLVADTSWPERLADAVALSASAVLRPLAGDVDLAAYRRFRDTVSIEEI
ncbi:MAG: tagatose 6-phosphate kinase [Actinomycetota bacterium]|nr:Tagatose 6-phosphate kinase [Cryptosporangiaceae bacterium]MDQ1676193.1 tagatose 6-phosphate kinase [Actinomycetota bacterium]